MIDRSLAQNKNQTDLTKKNEDLREKIKQMRNQLMDEKKKMLE